MRNALLVVLCGSVLSLPALGQVGGEQTTAPGGVASIGFSASYSPDSSHILIGLAEQRRTWTAGVELTHLMKFKEKVRWDYEASVMPLYAESDPTTDGETTTIAGSTFVMPQSPVRVVTMDRSAVGVASTATGTTAPIYPLYGRQTTFAAAVAPLGFRVSAFPNRGLQPSFAVDMGFVVSSRDIPVNDSNNFNYMFAFGPGIQLYATQMSSVRLEYLYRHISNAHSGVLNPGVDQGVIRLTLSHHRN